MGYLEYFISFVNSLSLGNSVVRTFLESNMPVPIAKNTINGINLYGTIMKEENPWIKGDDKRMPNIKNIIESV